MNEPEESPNPVGNGRPATMGGTPDFRSTMGRPLAGQMGRPHAYPSLEETSLASVDGDYAITLEKENGDRLAITEIIGDFSPTRDHSAISDWQITVPYDPDELEEWTFDTRVWVTWDGRRIFNGYCKSVSSGLQSGESVLSGYGPGVDLDSGVYSFDFRNIQVWRAFENMFDDMAEEWTYHVTRPSDPITIRSFSVDGTGLECIEQLADEYNWNFLVEQSIWKHIEAFKPGTLIANAAWETIDAEREIDTDGYYNTTYVIGDRDEDGDRIVGYYEDSEEIDRHAAERGLSYDDALKSQTVKESSIDSQSEADSVARARTQEAIAEAEVSGTIDTWPTMTDPGKAYPVREWDDFARVGPYSLSLDEDGHVNLPESLFDPLEDGGGFAMWIRADWDSIDTTPALVSNTFSMVDYLEFEIADQRVNAAPDGVGDGWILIHYDWDGSEVRAGHNGTIHDTESLGEIPEMPSLVILGAALGDYFEGMIDYVQVFNTPLSESQYRDIYNGVDIPARVVRARYKCNEGPNRRDNVLFDARGGHHGELTDINYAGSPKILESVDFSHGHGTANSTLNFVKDRSVPAEINRLKRQMQRRD